MSNKEQEIWKTYPDYDFIEVSNLGRVRTKDHWVTYKNGRKRLYKSRILKQYLYPNGYIFVHFKVNGETVNLLVHRLVATCFIPNPNNYPEVNHIDNDPKNNAVSNLEWCSREYNEAYKKNFGTSQAEVSGRPVIVISLDSLKVMWFESQSEASCQLGIINQSINKVVKGKLNKTHGFWFCYADSTAIEKTRAKFGNEVAKKVEELINKHNN